MEDRRKLSVSDKNGIINNLTRKGYSQEVTDLVKEDLNYGLTQEQTQQYLLKKYDIRQMRIYSQCMRKGYSKEIIAAIMKDGLDGYQMQIALEFYQKGIPIETITQITDNGAQAIAMQQTFQRILDDMSNIQDVGEGESEYVKQLMTELKDIVLKIDTKNRRYDVLNEKLKIFESTKKDEEATDDLRKALGKKDQEILEQKDKIDRAHTTIAKLRNDMDAIREEKSKMENRIVELEGKREAETIFYNKEAIVGESHSETGKLITNHPQPMPYIYGIPTYYVPVRGTGKYGSEKVEIETKTTKRRDKLAILSKFLFKKKSRQDIVKQVIDGELVPTQLTQIRKAIEQKLTEDQIIELIHSKATAEQMQEVIDIAVRINSLDN